MWINYSNSVFKINGEREREKKYLDDCETQRNKKVEDRWDKISKIKKKVFNFEQNWAIIFVE